MITGTNTHDLDVYRPTMVDETSGDSSRSWGKPHEEDVPVTLVDLSAGRTREEFGIEGRRAVRITLDEGVDVEVDDVVRIVAGPSYVADEFLVIDKRHHPATQTFVLGATITNDGPGAT